MQVRERVPVDDRHGPAPARAGEARAQLRLSGMRQAPQRHYPGRFWTHTSGLNEHGARASERAENQRRAVKARRVTSIGERPFDPFSIASRIACISAANWPRLSPNRPTFLLASARFLLAFPTPLPTRIPIILRPERLDPRATPPAKPRSAAPPASAGPFSLLAASLPFDATSLTVSVGPLGPAEERWLRLLELLALLGLLARLPLEDDDGVEPFARCVRLPLEDFLRVLVWAILQPSSRILAK